ncbi:MAG: RNA polymerase sigma factor, partial [Myxococcales bacterium]|nr:RNA polymerase sigma factor [Myxococcales bacterium]
MDDAPSNVVPLPRPTSLLEALRRGEATAVAELFDRHATTVERAAQAVLGLDPEVEDLVQDAFVAALRGIDGFRGDDRTLGPWVRGIVVRLALKKLRWRRARRWLGWPSTEEALLEVPGLTDTETQAALRRAHALLQRLPPVERAAFGMRFIEGMRLEEVAESLGISLATTKRRLERARRRFGRLAGRDALLGNWRGRE